MIHAAFIVFNSVQEDLNKRLESLPILYGDYSTACRHMNSTAKYDDLKIMGKWQWSLVYFKFIHQFLKGKILTCIMERKKNHNAELCMIQISLNILHYDCCK